MQRVSGVRARRHWPSTASQTGTSVCLRASVLVPRYKLADRHTECPFSDDDTACSTSGSGRAYSCQPGANSDDAARLSLERLWAASPLEWSSRFRLVTLEGREPPAREAVLAAGQQQQERQQQQQQQQTPPPEQREKSPDYYANVGDAIRTLREDIPQLFDRELNFSIYRDDIVFRDPRNSFQGMKNYKTIFWSLRFHGRIFFKKLYVEVKRIWQTEDGCIRMRWTAHGVPRVPWEAEGTFDGISQYKLDREGKIYEHMVDNVILRDPPVAVAPWLWGLNLVPQRQQAVPGAFFEPGAAGAESVAVATTVLAADAAAAAACEEREQQPHHVCSAHSAACESTLQGSSLAGGDLSFYSSSSSCNSGDGSILQQQQQQQPGWWLSLLARFSWVRCYAATAATMQVLQQQHEQLRLQPTPVLQRVCTERL